jgi:hypothetical protein
LTWSSSQQPGFDIDAGLLPVTARFAVEEKARQGKVLDGPEVVTQVRNRLVHPRGGQERVYRLEGLVAEVWLLIRHYAGAFDLSLARIPGLLSRSQEDARVGR